MLDQLILAIVLTACSCACFIVVLAAVAKHIKLVDKPDSRKQHSGEVPIIGGLAMYLAVLLTTLVVHPTWWALSPLVVGSGLVVMGVIDDRFAISSVFRLVLQTATALAMVYVGQVGIESVGDIFGRGDVVMGGLASVAFTVVCTVGVINSINMIDGVDGLSALIISITLLPLTFYAWRAGDDQSVLLMASFLAALAVFLCFNSRLFLRRAAVFMGDAGSMLFGLFLVWYFIRLTQGERPPMSPVAAGWIYGLPLADTIAVMYGRILASRSPLNADRSHFHHKLIATGFSVNQTVAIMGIFQIGFVLVGVVCNEIPKLEAILFWLFVLVIIIHYYLTPVILKYVSSLLRRG